MANTLTAPASPRRIDLALAIIRVVVGAIFIAHGGQKLFVYGLDGVTGAFTQMGAPLPQITAPLVAVVEFFGGIALVLGLLTRLAAIGIALVMLGAILLVHLKNGFFAPTGFEFPLALLTAAVAFAVTGGGTYSVDRRIFARRAPR